MYETHFGLRHRPFRAAPDSSCYYPATGHERALACLSQAVADGEGFALLTGGPGVGKTLLAQGLLDRLGAEVVSACVTNSHVAGRAGLLQAILYDLAQPYERLSEQELRLALTDFLLKTFTSGKKTVLILDEAHHLGPDLLEELRLLGNLEARGGKALQVVLSAQPALLDQLRRPDLACLDQRIAARAFVEPMNAQEAADYLLHQLRLAGARPHEVLAAEALEVLARATDGVPRRLNQAAHQALLLAHQAGSTCVDAEIALEALRLLGLEMAEESMAEGGDEGDLTLLLSEAENARRRAS